MELRHMIGFLAVADELHFGRAADKLHMAQPPLSQQIRQLERELGVRLFDRTTRSVRLTPAGEAFREPAKRALAEVGRAREAALAGAHHGAGRLRIGCTRASTYEILPRLARAIHERTPNIELELHGSVHATVGLSGLRNGELDLAFVRVPPADPAISTRVVRVDELRIVLPIGHPLAGRSRVALGELAGERFVTFPALRGSAVRDALVRACLQTGFAPRIVQEDADPDTIMALVGAGVGVTLMTTTNKDRRVHGVAVRPIDGETITVPLEIAWRTTDTSHALHAALRIAEEILPTPPSETR